MHARLYFRTKNARASANVIDVDPQFSHFRAQGVHLSAVSSRTLVMIVGHIDVDTIVDCISHVFCLTTFFVSLAPSLVRCASVRV